MGLWNFVKAAVGRMFSGQSGTINFGVSLSKSDIESELGFSIKNHDWNQKISEKTMDDIEDMKPDLSAFAIGYYDFESLKPQSIEYKWSIKKEDVEVRLGRPISTEHWNEFVESGEGEVVHFDFASDDTKEAYVKWENGGTDVSE